MRIRAADGLELAVSVRDPDGGPATGEGPPLLLLHGFGGSAGAWGEAALAGLAGWRILAVDLPGHGASDDPAGPGRVALERVLDDLERVLDRAGASACPWIGYSMGGRIALAAAVLRPGRVSRVILESASPGIDDPVVRAERRARDEALAARIEREGVAAWVEEWERQPLLSGRGGLPAAEREAFLELRRANRPASLTAWLRGLGTGVQPSFWPRLPEVHAPALVLTGERDVKFTEIGARMASAFREAESVVVPHAGHTVHREAPRAWAAAVTPFLVG